MAKAEQALDHLFAAFAWFVETLSAGRFWLGAAVGAMLLAGAWFLIIRRRYRATQVALSLPFGLGKITYEATDRDRVLAWKMYVQLKTRKAALPFDQEHDVIASVFDSLYQIFPVTRHLLSEAHPHQGDAQRSVADFILRVLNDGIRPHVTRWHATYRTWWDKAVDAVENKGRLPQEVQREFPQYADLTADLKKMNGELAKYAEELLAIVHARPGGRRLAQKKVEVVPQQPGQCVGPEAPTVAAACVQGTAPANAEKNENDTHE